MVSVESLDTGGIIVGSAAVCEVVPVATIVPVLMALALTGTTAGGALLGLPNKEIQFTQLAKLRIIHSVDRSHSWCTCNNVRNTC